MECPAWLEWLATGLSLWCFMAARFSSKAGVESASCFADVEFGAFGAMHNIHDVVRLAIELFGYVVRKLSLAFEASISQNYWGFSLSLKIVLLHRLQEGLRQGLACSFVGNHEEVYQHKPYPSHQKPL